MTLTSVALNYSRREKHPRSQPVPPAFNEVVNGVTEWCVFVQVTQKIIHKN